MLSQLSWDPWHVGRLPSEDIFVVPEKVGEREFLFFWKVGTNKCCLGGITSTQVNLDDFLVGRWCNDTCLLSQNLHVFGLSLLCKVGNVLCYKGLLRLGCDLDSFCVTIIGAL